MTTYTRKQNVRLGGLGRVLRIQHDQIPKAALKWTTKGKRKQFQKLLYEKL